MKIILFMISGALTIASVIASLLLVSPYSNYSPLLIIFGLSLGFIMFVLTAILYSLHKNERGE
jgi:hypothetical protein